MPSLTIQENLRAIRISGADRAQFLQGQLTQDVGRAVPDATIFAGWADVKGRLLWAGRMFALDQSFCLIVPNGIADTIAARLRMYVLRARVVIDLPDLQLAGVRRIDALPTASEWPAGARLVRDSHDSSRAWLIGSGATPGAAGAMATMSPQEWLLDDIRAGLPEIGSHTTGEFVPQMVNLDLLDAISFDKGCYIGQEIVARMRYLGRVKRRMLRFSGTGTPPGAGDPVHASRGVVGKFVAAASSGCSFECLAVVHVDDWPGPFFVDAGGGQPLAEQTLPYRIPEFDSRK